MSKRQNETIAGFTTGERAYIRRELDQFFSTPGVTEDFQLKTTGIAQFRCKSTRPAYPSPGAPALNEQEIRARMPERHLLGLRFAASTGPT